MLLGAQLFVELVGLNGELAADSVLDIEDGRVKVGRREGPHLASVLVKAAEEEEGGGWGTGGSSAGEGEHLATRLFERKVTGRADGRQTGRRGETSQAASVFTPPSRIAADIADALPRPSSSSTSSAAVDRSQRAADTGSGDDRSDMVVVGSSPCAHRSRSWPVAESARTSPARALSSPFKSHFLLFSPSRTTREINERRCSAAVLQAVSCRPISSRSTRRMRYLSFPMQEPSTTYASSSSAQVRVSPPSPHIHASNTLFSRAVPFPDGYGATVHFHWPGKGFQLLGMYVPPLPRLPLPCPATASLSRLSNDKPSAIFRLRGTFSAQTSRPALFNADSAPTVDTTAILGIAIEPLPTIEAEMASLPNAVARPNTPLPDATLLAERIVKHLFNYVSGFMGGGPITPESVVPMAMIAKWYEVFVGKVRNTGIGFLDNQE